MFDLERLEKGLLIFLLAALLLGAGIIAYRKSFPTGDLRVELSETRSRSPEMSSLQSTSGDYRKININKASSAELTSLKGVGPVLAGRIVEYRTQKGLFLSKEDLKKVPGIGNKLFSKIEDGISLE